jgi:hypothetical protein
MRLRSKLIFIQSHWGQSPHALTRHPILIPIPLIDVNLDIPSGLRSITPTLKLPWGLWPGHALRRALLASRGP